MHKLNKETNDWIAENNASYKLQADVKKRLKNFNIGDF